MLLAGHRSFSVHWQEGGPGAEGAEDCKYLRRTSFQDKSNNATADDAKVDQHSCQVLYSTCELGVGDVHGTLCCRLGDDERSGVWLSLCNSLEQLHDTLAVRVLWLRADAHLSGKRCINEWHTVVCTARSTAHYGLPDFPSTMKHALKQRPFVDHSDDDDPNADVDGHEQKLLRQRPCCVWISTIISPEKGATAWQFILSQSSI
mmetsp:Transcript_41865/g.76060  ORF Transcript_41865/g.76060 Transcript_41865/m.76060 type:complete len:204 (+) Transcript_41865:2957-3568(+)